MDLISQNNHLVWRKDSHNMIFVENTPNNVGVAICGDYKDFEALYEALQSILAGDNECRFHIQLKKS